MTVKTRNRLNLTLFAISIVVFIFDATFFILKLLRGNLDLSYFSFSKNEASFFTRTNPYITIASLFIQILYVICTSFLLFRIFEKTQASAIVYFHLFLWACLIDTFRLWIPLFNLAESYSNLLIFCGNSTIFAKILIPLSLLFSVAMTDVEKRQNIEKYVFILLCVSFFFSQVIPLNTSIEMPNFSVDYSYKLILKVSTTIIITVCVISQFITNRQNMYTQKTTIGYLLIFIGTFLLFNSINLFRLTVSLSALTTGTIMYLKGLHNQYLWYY